MTVCIAYILHEPITGLLISHRSISMYNVHALINKIKTTLRYTVIIILFKFILKIGQKPDRLHIEPKKINY